MRPPRRLVAGRTRLARRRVDRRPRRLRARHVAPLIGAVALLLPAGAHAERPAPATAKEAFATQILPRNWRFFVAIGRCEQPGDGRWGIDWTHPGPTYPGGLGVYAPLWTEPGIAGTDLAPSAPEATPIEQMIQAQRIVDRYGVYAWGCAGVALAQAPYFE